MRAESIPRQVSFFDQSQIRTEYFFLCNNIGLKRTEERPKGRSSFMLYRAKLGLICGSLLELSCFELSKLEADLEVSILELYYSAKSWLCEHKKGSVCEKVAIV